MRPLYQGAGNGLAKYTLLSLADAQAREEIVYRTVTQPQYFEPRDWMTDTSQVGPQGYTLLSLAEARTRADIVYRTHQL